jgi:hypothetical protein
MIDAGIVSYHDAQEGFIRGVPDLKYYLKSQDPIKWGLVEGAGLIFLLFWLIKAAQFHGFCEFVGIRGTFTQHARAYLEGIGVNRLLPFIRGAAWRKCWNQAPRSKAAQAASWGIFVASRSSYTRLRPVRLGWSVWLARSSGRS